MKTIKFILIRINTYEKQGGGGSTTRGVARA